MSDAKRDPGATLNAIEDLIDRTREAEEKYRQLAEELIYKSGVVQGNSVGWWHSKATAYRAALERAWEALNEAGVKADGEKDVAAGIRELAARVKHAD